MTTNQGSHYTLVMNSEFQSDEWELTEAWGHEGNMELAVESSPAIGSHLDCIQPITNLNSQHQIGEAIELDNVSHRESSSGSGTLTECQPELEHPPSMPRLLLAQSNPQPALDDFISTCMSPADSTTSLRSLRMDLDLVEPDNDHHEHNSINGMDHKRSETEPEEFTHQPPVLEPVEKPGGSTCMSPTESTLSSHSLHMDWDLEEDDNDHHQSHNSDTEDRSAIVSEEFTHHSPVLGPVEDPLEESDSEDEEELLVPEFYTLKIQHLFQEVTKTQTDATNLKMPEYSNQQYLSQTKQPEEPLLYKQENVSQYTVASRPPSEVLLSDKKFESRAGAKGCMKVNRFAKVTEVLQLGFSSEVERPCHGSSGYTCFEKNNLVAGDDRDIEGSSKPPQYSERMKKMVETHGLMQHQGGQYNKSGPLISDKLSLCRCKQCGCYFGSETTLGHHQKVCQGVIYCACDKSCDLYKHKEHGQNHDGILAPPKKDTASQKLSKLALLSAKSTDHQERVKNHCIVIPLKKGTAAQKCILTFSTTKHADCKEQMPRKKGRTRRVRKSKKGGDDQFQQSLLVESINRKGGILDHTYSAKPCQPSLCEICGLCFPNCVLLENHAREHVHERSNICPPQKPVTMYPMNSGKFSEKTKNMLQNNKKEQVYQLLQRQPNESINPTSKKTDSKSQPKNGGPDQFQQSLLVESIKHTSKKTDSQSQPKKRGSDQFQKSELKESMKKTDSQPHQRQRTFVLLRGEGKHPLQCLAEDKKAIKIHDNSIIPVNVLQCTWCKTYFRQRDSFRQHKCKMKPVRADPYTYAGAYSYLCEYCGCSVAGHFTFIMHLAEHWCILPKTKECSIQLQSANIADCTPAINNACEGRKPFWCQICSKAFLSESQLLSHKNIHRIESLHPVPLQQQPHPCIGDANTESRVKNSGSGLHVDAVGCSPILEFANIADSTPVASSTSIMNKPFVCQICSKTFSFERLLLRHRNVHRLESRRPVLKREPPEPDKDDESTQGTVKKARSGKRGSIGENTNGWRFDMADTSPEASSTSIRSKPFVCQICSKAFAFESQLLRHRNVHRLESRRPVPKRELPEPDKYDESIESWGGKKKGCKQEEKYGWRFKIIGADGEIKSGTRRRGAGGRKNQQQGPKLAPRWGRRAHSKVEVKRYVCRACGKGFSHPWRLRKHMAIHSYFNCDKCDGLSFASSVELSIHLLAHTGLSESASPERQGPESSAPKENTESSAAKELKSQQSGQPKESNEALIAKELKSTHSTHCESNSKSLIAQELESVHRGHPEGRRKSSKAKGLQSKQSGQSEGSNKFSTSKERKSTQSGQPKKRTKSIAKKLPVVQSRKSNGGDKSSREKAPKSGPHRQPKGNIKSTSRTKDSKCLKSDQPDVDASLPKIGTLGDKRFYCNLCSLGFQRSSQLKHHMVIHSDISCDNSDGVTFPSSAKLKSHLPTHTVQFKCRKCDASFASQKSLTNHVASHSDPVPHVCDVCLFAFKSLKSLKTHQIMTHFRKL